MIYGWTHILLKSTKASVFCNNGFFDLSWYFLQSLEKREPRRSPSNLSCARTVPVKQFAHAIPKKGRYRYRFISSPSLHQPRELKCGRSLQYEPQLSQDKASSAFAPKLTPSPEDLRRLSPNRNFSTTLFQYTISIATHQ